MRSQLLRSCLMAYTLLIALLGGGPCCCGFAPIGPADNPGESSPGAPRTCCCHSGSQPVSLSAPPSALPSDLPVACCDLAHDSVPSGETDHACGCHIDENAATRPESVTVATNSRSDSEFFDSGRLVRGVPIAVAACLEPVPRDPRKVATGGRALCIALCIWRC